MLNKSLQTITSWMLVFIVEILMKKKTIFILSGKKLLQLSRVVEFHSEVIPSDQIL